MSFSKILGILFSIPRSFLAFLMGKKSTPLISSAEASNQVYSNRNTYIVQSGDYLGKIANKLGVSVTDLSKANNIKNPNSIRVGQVLTIPNKSRDKDTAKNDNKLNTLSDSKKRFKKRRTPISSDKPQKTYMIKSGDNLSRVAKIFGVSIKELSRVNNITNSNNIRVGQVLKIPINNNYNNTDSRPVNPTEPNNSKVTAKPADDEQITYVIQSGDYLSKIAKKFAISIKELSRANNITNPNSISVGQVLIIPNTDTNGSGNSKNGGNKPTKPKPKEPIKQTPKKRNKTYRIKSGDYLTKIAKKFGLTTRQLILANHITDPNNIRVGQLLIIPAKNVSKPIKIKPKPVDNEVKVTYTVKPGDYLSKIAKKFDISVNALIKANKIRDPNNVRIGNVLIIPIDKNTDNSPLPLEPKPVEPKPIDNDIPNISYTIKAGDYLSKIANKFDVSVRSLIKINNITNPNNIRVGQVLLIPKSAINNNDDVNKPNMPNQPEPPQDKCSKKFHKVSRIILRHEGGYVDDPDDAGGKTNKGIAWKTWQSFSRVDLGLEPTKENLRRLTDEQAEIIYRKRYWEPQGFCEINNDRVGLMVYDWTITSGGAAKQVQKLLVNEFGQDISVDGAMGPQTIQALNNVANQNYLLARITYIRKAYYHMLVERRPANKRFIKGWINRVDDCLNVNI